MAALSILVSKNNAVSLAKIADNPVVKPGEGIGAMLSVGNNADNTMNLITMDLSLIHISVLQKQVHRLS